MADMDDDGKFREIDDESFDDSGNMYFHFHDPSDTGGVRGSDLAQGMDGLLGEMMEMSLGFVEHVLSLFPGDVQESGELAMRAVSAAAAGDAETSNRLLHLLRKRIGTTPGICKAEADNLMNLISEALAMGDEEKASRLMKKERKLLSEYIKLAEKDGSQDFMEYLSARTERARISEMLGLRKGVFSAAFEMPEGAEFRMEDFLSGLDRFYENTADDEHDDTMYLFLSGAGNAVRVQYADPSVIISGLSEDPEKAGRFTDLLDAFDMHGSYVTVTVEAGKDISSAALDLQQVLAALIGCYPGTRMIAIGNDVVPEALIPAIAADSEDGYFCEAVMYMILYEDTNEGRSVLRSHSAPCWGRQDIGIVISGDEDDKEFSRLVAVICEVLAKHIAHRLEDGDHVEALGMGFRVHEQIYEEEPVLLLTERKDG